MKKNIKNLYYAFKDSLSINNIYIIIFIMLLLIFLLVQKKLYYDPDTFFIIKNGNLLRELGYFTKDYLTFHNFNFYPQQPLICILFSYIDKFGIFGFKIMLTILIFIIYFIVYKLFRLRNKNTGPLILSFIVVFCFLIINYEIRPNYFDIALLLLELYFLESYEKYNKKYLLLFIPLIGILFINLHASTVFLLIVFILPYIGEYILKIISNKDNRKENINKVITYLVLIIITIISFLITPYDIKGITYLFNSTSPYINKLVPEMRPYINKVNIVSLIILIITLIYVIKNIKVINYRHIFLYFGTLFITLIHVKGLVYFYISIILINTYINRESKDYKIKPNYSYYYRIIKIILILLSIIIFIGIINSNNIVCNIKDKPEYKLVKELDKIVESNNESKDKLKVYITSRLGSFLEYYDYHTYIDCRAEVFLKSLNKKYNYYEEYYKLQNNNINKSKFIDKYNFDYIITYYKGDSLYNYDFNNYELLYKDKYFKLYRRVL